MAKKKTKKRTRCSALAHELQVARRRVKALEERLARARAAEETRATARAAKLKTRHDRELERLRGRQEAERARVGKASCDPRRPPSSGPKAPPASAPAPSSASRPRGSSRGRRKASGTLDLFD